VVPSGQQGPPPLLKHSGVYEKQAVVVVEQQMLRDDLSTDKKASQGLGAGSGAPRARIPVSTAAKPRRIDPSGPKARGSSIDIQHKVALRMYHHDAPRSPNEEQ
jgi:hypothetical protein